MFSTVFNGPDGTATGAPFEFNKNKSSEPNGTPSRSVINSKGPLDPNTIVGIPCTVKRKTSSLTLRLTPPAKDVVTVIWFCSWFLEFEISLLPGLTENSEYLITSDISPLMFKE